MMSNTINWLSGLQLLNNTDCHELGSHLVLNRHKEWTTQVSHKRHSPLLLWIFSQTGQGNQMFGSSTSFCTHAREGCSVFWPKPLCLNVCLWVTYTVFNQGQVQAVCWCPGWSTSDPTWPPGQRKCGHTQQVPCPTEQSQFWLWYQHGLEWLQQRQQMKLAVRRGLALQHMGYGCSVHLGCKGQQDKPSKLALITYFTVSKAL